MPNLFLCIKFKFIGRETVTKLNCKRRIDCCKMFLAFSLFFLLTETKEVVSLLRCPSVVLPRHGRVTCMLEKHVVSCMSKLPVGSVVEFSCNEFYKLSSEENVLKCLKNGSWSAIVPTCVPDCGRRHEPASLIVNGVVAPRGSFPWHVALYYFIDGKYEYWCGGSLVSESAVVTAAHCVWEVSRKNLTLVMGKFHREFNVREKNSQRRKARKIEMLSSYQDVLAPVCVDWDQQLMGVQLTEGNSGVVAGWGLTENDSFGDFLRAVQLPVVSNEKCIARQEPDFRKFITYTTFCAGFANRTGVCNGDSGGGLTFFYRTSGRWYLQGVVSVSPRKKGTPFCDLDFFTVFTKVGMFSKWLKTELEKETQKETFNEPLKNFFFPEGNKGNGKGKKMIYPHTQKMLELARLPKSSRTVL